MLCANQIVLAVPNEQILFEYWLLVVDGDAGGKAAVGCLDVAIAVIDSNNLCFMECFQFVSSLIVLLHFFKQFREFRQLDFPKKDAVDPRQGQLLRTWKA